MTNICTKVTVRKRPLKDNQLSLYLDFYPAIRHPKTGKMTRREYLGIYIYAHPTTQFQVEYNQSMLEKAEIIKCRRTEAIINREYGFLDRNHGKESFLEYYKSKIEGKEAKTWGASYDRFSEYCDGKCYFSELSVKFCQGFMTYLTEVYLTKQGKHIMGTTANNIIKYFRAILRDAFDDGLIKENIGNKIELAKNDANPREFLSLDEVKQLVSTPCVKPVLKNASLFSCLMGLRLSDVINLKWQNIEKASDGGLCMHIIIIKTGKEVFLPLSDDALKLCGERQTSGPIFKGLTKNMVTKYLKPWVKSADIGKYITFHCFRHTFATLQFAAGTDIYTISSLLSHSNISTTQVYTSVVNSVKRDASNKIKLE